IVTFSGLGTRPVVHEVLLLFFIVLTLPVSMMLLARAALFRDRSEAYDASMAAEARAAAEQEAAALAAAQEEAAALARRDSETGGDDDADYSAGRAEATARPSAGAARARRRGLTPRRRPRFRSAPDDLPAVHVDRLAGDVRRVLRRQVDVGRRHLLGLAGPPEGLVGAELRDLLGREARRYERRPDGPRRHGVHPDALLRQVRGQRAREREDRALRGRVVHQVGAAAVGGDRGGVDDAGALLEVRHGRARQVELREHVRPEGLLELLVADALDGPLVVLFRGVVHQHVEAAELLHDALDG